MNHYLLRFCSTTTTTTVTLVHVPSQPQFTTVQILPYCTCNVHCKCGVAWWRNRHCRALPLD